jgi:hypothetical protein
MVEPGDSEPYGGGGMASLAAPAELDPNPPNPPKPELAVGPGLTASVVFVLTGLNLKLDVAAAALNLTGSKRSRH